MFGIEEFPISAEHASQLMRGDMCIERFLNDNLNAPDDISRFKGLLLEGDTIDHVTVDRPRENIIADGCIRFMQNFTDGDGIFISFTKLDKNHWVYQLNFRIS